MVAKRRLNAAVCLSLFMSASAAPFAYAQEKEGEAPAPVVLPRPAKDTAVFILDRCPISKQGGAQEGFFAALGALLLPLAKSIIKPVVETGIDLIARKLDQRALDMNASATGRSNGQFFEERLVNNDRKIAPSFGCVAVIRGDFISDNQSENVDAILRSAGAGKPGAWTAENIADVNTALFALSRKDEPFARRVQISSVPEFYAEFPLEIVMADAAVVEAEPDGDKKGGAQRAVRSSGDLRVPTNFSLRPELVDYRVRGTKIGKAGKQIVIDLSIEGVVATAEGEQKATLFSHTYDIGQMAPGDRKRLPHYDAPLAPAPSPAVVTKQYVAEGRTGALEGQTVAVTHLVPFAATVTVRELEKGGDFEKAIAQSLRDNKESIVTPILALSEEQLKKALGVKDEKKDDAK